MSSADAHCHPLLVYCIHRFKDIVVICRHYFLGLLGYTVITKILYDKLNIYVMVNVVKFPNAILKYVGSYTYLFSVNDDYG